MNYENVITEFKKEYVEDIKKTVIAFANTNGGTIFIGKDDEGKIVGLKDPDEIIQKVTNTIRDTIKPDVTLFTKCDIEKIEGKYIVIIRVQKGTSSPYYLYSKGIRPEGVYIRQGTSSVPASEAAILKMIKETDGEKYEDVRSMNQNLTFLETKKQFKELAIKFERSQMKTLHIINQDSMYTNLALLLSEQCLHTLKIAVFEGINKNIFIDRREFSGSLLKQLSECYEFIDQRNRIRSEFEGLKRKDTPDYPVEAIREMLLNAIIHRDYSFRDSNLISIFDDRIECVSVGGLAKGMTKDDVTIGVSIKRNPNLADVFFRLGLIESFGLGMQKIFDGYRNMDLQPYFEVTSNGFKVVLYNRNYLSGTIDKNAEDLSKIITLSENETKIMRLMNEKGRIKRKDVELHLNISQAGAVNLLRGLTKKELIYRMGKGKNIKYTLVE